MITYLLTTYLLSGVGLILYVLFGRKNTLLKHRRWMVHSIIALSLVLPLLPGLNNKAIITSIPQSAAGECIPILFEENGFFNFLISNNTSLSTGLALVSLVVLIVLLVRILFLIHLVKACLKEQLEMEGKVYHILYTNKKIAIGSFHLWHKYIVWPETMNELAASEKKAILWHEISHLNNKSTWEKLALGFLQVVWFLNPAIYFLKKELNSISEYQADEDTVDKLGDKVHYAELLLKLKMNQQIAFSHAFLGSSLKKRIARLLNQKEYNKSKGVFGIVGLITLLLLAVFTFQPKINKYENSFALYGQMHKVHEATGRMDFCTKCLTQCLRTAKEKSINE
jgi:bla regulator protein BlaR1